MPRPVRSDFGASSSCWVAPRRCGCAGLKRIVRAPPPRLGTSHRELQRLRAGECLPAGDLDALEAATKNLTRRLGDRWGAAAGERVRARGLYWPAFWENELQFAATRAVLAAFETAFLGVGVILVAGERGANARRRARAEAFAAWIGRVRGGSAADVWAYARPRRSLPARTTPRNIHMPAAASPRRASAEYLRPRRGVAAARLRGISTYTSPPQYPRRYVLRPEAGPLEKVGKRALGERSAFPCDASEANASCGCHGSHGRGAPCGDAAAAGAAPRRFHIVDRDFAAEFLPPAPAWGHAVAYARGDAFDGLEDWDLS